MEQKTIEFMRDAIKKILLICFVSMLCISLVSCIAIFSMSINYSKSIEDMGINYSKTIEYIYDYEYTAPDITNTNTINEKE